MPSVNHIDTSAAQTNPPIDDSDLASAYSCDLDLASPPDLKDPFYYHRIAALDIHESPTPSAPFKHMLRGEAYIGLATISAFSIHIDSKGLRTLTPCT